MLEEKNTPKNLLANILRKYPQASVQVVNLKLYLESTYKQKPKITKEDCLNPYFLIKLSQCGERIKNIMVELIRQYKSEALESAYHNYMKIVKQIRKYHQQAHQNYSEKMHINSTEMKSRLLQELKLQSQLRKESQAKLQQLTLQYQEELIDREELIQQLREEIILLGREGGTCSQFQQVNFQKQSISQQPVDEKENHHFGRFYNGKSAIKAENILSQNSKSDMEQQASELGCQSSLSHQLQTIVLQNQKLQEKLKQKQQQLEKQQIMFKNLQQDLAKLSIKFQQEQISKNRVNPIKSNFINQDYADWWRFMFAQSASLQQCLKETGQQSKLYE